MHCAHPLMSNFIKCFQNRNTLTLFSAKAEITFPRADKDLLMFLASSSTAPSAPVLLTCNNVGSCKKV